MQLEDKLKLFSEITFELEKIDNKKFNEYLTSERKNATTEEEQIQIVQDCIEKTRDKINEIFTKVSNCEVFLESEKNKLKTGLTRLYRLMDALSYSVTEGFNSPNYIVNLNNYRELWLAVYSCVNPEKNEYLEQINQAIANGETTIEKLSSINGLHPNHMAIIDNVRQGKNEYPVLQNPYEENETSNEYIPDLNAVGTKVDVEIARYEHGMYQDRSSLVDRIIEIYKEFNQDEISSKLDEIRDSIINLTGLAPEDVDYSLLKDQLSASKKLELLTLMNQYKRWNEILDTHVNEDAFEKFRIELTETLRDYEDAIRLRDELAAQPTKFNFFDFKGKHDRKVIERTIKKRFKVKTVDELEAKLTDLKFNRGTILTEQQSSVKLTLRNQKKQIERSSKFEAGLEITSDAAQKFGKVITGVATTVGTFTSTKYQAIKDKIDESRKEKEIEYNGGDLDLSDLESAKGIKFPEVIDGYLNLSGLKNVKSLDLSNMTINGDLYLSGLKSAKDLNLSNTKIDGVLSLLSLKSVKDLDLSNTTFKVLRIRAKDIGEVFETFDGDLVIIELTSAEDLILPRVIDGNLQLSGLKSAKGLVLPEEINGFLDLDGLTSIDGLDLSNTTIKGDLKLNDIKSAEGLDLSNVTFNGYLGLANLISAKGLVLPKVINGDLWFMRLQNAEDLDLSNVTINGNLILDCLTSAKDLDLSNVTVNGEIYLRGLTTTEGLENIPEHLRAQVILPAGMSFQSVNISPTSQEEVQVIEYHGGDLNLNNLDSAKGIKFPEVINGWLYLNGLTSAEDLILPKKINGGVTLDGLTSAKGLDLSGVAIERSIYLNGLTSAKDLDLSNVTVNGEIYLNGLTTNEGLENIPEPLRSKLRIPQNVVSLGANGLDSSELLNNFGMRPSLEGTEPVVSYSEGLNPVISEQPIDKPKKRILREEPVMPTSEESSVVSEQPTDTPVQVENDSPTSEETSQEEVQVIEYHGGNLDLRGLESAKGIKFPEVIDGDLILNGLTSAEGLDLSNVTVKRGIWLTGLTSAKGLDLSTTKIVEDLMICAKDLGTVCENLDCALIILNLDNAEGLILPKVIDGYLYLNDLKSAEGLILPKEINGYLSLESLTSAAGLDLSSTTIQGSVYLRGLTTTEGLENIPEHLRDQVILPDGMSFDDVVKKRR